MEHNLHVIINYFEALHDLILYLYCSTAALESHIEKPSVVENTVLEAVVEKPLLVDKRGQVLDQFQLEAIGTLYLYKRIWECPRCGMAVMKFHY